MSVYGGLVWLGLKMMNHVPFFGVWNTDIYTVKNANSFKVYVYIQADDLERKKQS